MKVLWSKDDIIISKSGVSLLNKEASKRFYVVYKDKIDAKYADYLFPVDMAQKAYESCPRSVSEILGKSIGDEEKILSEYEKRFLNKTPDIKEFFEFLYSIPKLLNRKVDLEELKKFGSKLNKSLFDLNEEIFSIYVLINDNNFSFILENNCNNLYDLLNVLNVLKKVNTNPYDISCELIDSWLLKNKYYTLELKNEFIKFIEILSNKQDAYYMSNELLKYLNSKYDIKSLNDYGISVEEQINIVSNFDNTPEYLFKLASVLNKEDGISKEELIKYALFIKKKFNVDYEENSLKFFVRLPYEKNPVQLTNLLDDTNNLYDLLKLLQLPIIYNFDVCELNMKELNNWFDKHGYYEIKKYKILENKFLSELKTCPKDYYSSQIITMFLETKIKEIQKNNISSENQTEKDEHLKILKRYKPVTDTKKKKLIGAMLFGTGIIACFYLIVIREENPVTVIPNCVSTFKKYGESNVDFKTLLNSIGDLVKYFTAIATSCVGGNIILKCSDEDKLKQKKKVK